MIAASMCLVGCEMIEYHPYDSDIDGDIHINAKNVERIEQSLKGKREIAFAVVSDTQRWYDETEDAVESINRREPLDFVIHTGDLSDFGAKIEFQMQRDILNKLKVPYVCLLGNHDCLGSGEQTFRRIFGEPDFAFTAGNVRFICLNTNALEYDYSTAVPDFSFLRAEYANYPDQAEKTVVAMHAGPFSEQFNNNVAYGFEYALRKFPALQFCLYGHLHQITADEPFSDGVIYYQCTCAKKRAYLYFTINEEGYTYEVVEF